MIYVDTSVVLAQLLAEDEQPPADLWQGAVVSSRLVEYETWTRLNAERLARTHGEAARELLGRISLLEMTPLVLARALEPFPGGVRTLDALHLASVSFLMARRIEVSLATYDERTSEVATKLGLDLFDLRMR